MSTNVGRCSRGEQKYHQADGKDEIQYETSGRYDAHSKLKAARFGKVAFQLAVNLNGLLGADTASLERLLIGTGLAVTPRIHLYCATVFFLDRSI